MSLKKLNKNLTSNLRKALQKLINFIPSIAHENFEGTF